MRGPPLFSVTVRNLAVVTYSVPAERIQAHLPEPYELDIFEGQDGAHAFVSTTCFCNQDYRLAGAQFPRHTFNESTYRTYVRHKDRAGVYFFGRYLGTRLAWACQRPITRHAYNADFQIVADDDGNGGFARYICNANSNDGGTSFSLETTTAPKPQAPPTSSDDLAQFLTYRLHGFYTDSLGAQGHMPVQHPRMAAVEGRLSAGKFELWESLGILGHDEIANPYSVLVVSQVPFRLYTPRFLV